MKKLIYTFLIAALTATTANAQRHTDQLDRGVVAVKTSNGVFISWRQQADEYYDVTYNLYRENTRIAEGLKASNYTDAGGSLASTYSVAAVIDGVEQEKSEAKAVWTNDYLEVSPMHPTEIHSTLVPNDACVADIDGDGQVEILMKYDNADEVGNAMQKNGWFNEHTIFEVLELDGTVKWWVNCGPNMGDFQNNEQNIVGYDWDQDGKAEVLMRLEEGSTIHMADNTTYTIGADGNNGTAWTNYREPRGLSPNVTTVAIAFNLPANATAVAADSWLTTSIQNGTLYVTTSENETEGDGKHATGRSTTVTVSNGTTEDTYSVFQLDRNAPSTEWFTHYGKEFLVYCDGETGVPYDIIPFPCARLEEGETDLSAAWGDGYGHRSSKYFFGAPYLDGRNPSIFIGRGIYTRHKFVALDVNKDTHKLTERWRWMNNSGGPWYGQGYHNYAIVDVDWDGRDEIVWGSMVIDDNGMGLSTTGLGHGDAEHHSDLDPYRHGQEGFFCNEDNPGNNLRDLTTSKIYYRNIADRDDGRAIAGNFSNDILGAIASSSRDNANAIGVVAAKRLDGYDTAGMTQNFRCYWDGDLCEETFDGTGSPNYDDHPGGIYKYGTGLIKELTGSLTNNWTKATPCFMGDIMGDWREEFIMRTADNKIRIYTTTTETPWNNYSLWYDHQYRNGMVWEMCGYNQSPHVSYFLGELEGITTAPPALTMTGRNEIANGGIISSADGTIITCETNDMTVSVAEGAAPKVYMDNAPSWVQGSAPSEATSMQYPITYEYYTHTLTGAAFTGDTRVVKQGDGTLKLPDATQTYSGNTDVWGGNLAFNGTMQNSRLWMNRHTALYTAGTYEQPVTMEYGSRLCISEAAPNREGTVDTPDYTNATFSTLNLNAGARVVFDISPTRQQYDRLTVANLNLQKQEWEYGPEYNSPVFEVNNANSKISVGIYPLCAAENIDGDISDIVIESATGFANNTVRKLVIADGTIYLDVSYENEVYIGSKYNTSSLWTEFSPSYTLKAGNSCTFKFTNYGGKSEATNWILAAANGNGHSTDDRADYAEYFSLRADGTALASGHGTAATNVETTKDWTDNATFIADMAEADVEMTVTYDSNHEMFITAVITANSGNIYNLTAQYSDCSEEEVTLFFTVDHSHMTYPTTESTEAAPQVKMTYVDYNNADTAFGEVAVAKSGYNNTTNGYVGFTRTDWLCNWITYMEIDLSAYKGKDVNNVSLHFQGSGSTDNNRQTTWGVGYNNTAWTDAMTYNTADRAINLLGDAQGGSSTNSAVFDNYTFDITNAFLADADGVLTILVYNTAPAGGYVKNPSASIKVYEEGEAVGKDPTNVVNTYTELYRQDFENAGTIDDDWTSSVADRYHSEQLTSDDGTHHARYYGSSNGATFTFSALPGVGTDYTTAGGYTLDFDFALIPTNGTSSSTAQTQEFRILDTNKQELCAWKVTTESKTAAADTTAPFYLNLTDVGEFKANLTPYWYHVNIKATSDGTFLTITDKSNATTTEYTISENLIYVGEWTYWTAKDNGSLYLDDIVLNRLDPTSLTLMATERPDYESGIYSNVTVQRSFNAGYSSLCLPFSMTVDEFTGGDAEAYVAYLSETKNVSDGTKLVFVNADEIEANRPCIIYLSKALENPSFTNIAVHSADPQTITAGLWSMTGNYEPAISMYGKYGVAGNAAIKKGGVNSKLNGLSAYMAGPANANAKVVFGNLEEEDDTPTGVDAVKGSTVQKNGKYADSNAIIIMHNGKKYRVSGIDAQ